MNLRLKTTIDVETKLNELQSLLQVSSKAVIIRLAIAYSIKQKKDPRILGNSIYRYDVSKQNGADYNRFTIYGDDEMFFKIQMEQCLKKHLEDDEFFPEMTVAHMNRGLPELYADVQLAGSKEKFLRKLIVR